MDDMFEYEEPTLDLNKSATLARDVIGELTVEMTRLVCGDLLIEASYAGETVHIIRYPYVSEFQGGRLFEHEVMQFRGLVK